MKIIKQKLNPFAWLNIKCNHTFTPHTATPGPATSSTHFGPTHASSSTTSPQRKPRKRALLIGIAEAPSPDAIETRVAGRVRRDEVMLVDSPLPITPGRDTFTAVSGKRKSGSEPSLTVKNKSVTFSDPKPRKKLASAHNDVALMKKALTSWYGYKAAHITILIDDNKPGRKRPTRENILAEIDKLVQGIEPGDTVFFYFAGHGTQQDTTEVDEEDGKNEIMITCDGGRIIDNELHERLIKPLPQGSTLIAVCDACHSGSLLDLQHFRCNGVYVPWVNKGQRRTRIEQNHIQRQHARMSTQHAAFANRTHGWTPSTIDGILKAETSSTSPILEAIKEDQTPPHGRSSLSREYEGHSQLPPLPPSSPSHPRSMPPQDSPHPHPSRTPPTNYRRKSPKSLSLATNTSTWSADPPKPWFSDVDSLHQADIMDTPQNLYCTGFCREEKNRIAQSLNVVGSRPHADVICLSSSADSQKTWYDNSGKSMTYQLYQILKKNHNPTLTSLLKSISHSLHKSYLEIHTASRQHKERMNRINRERREKGKSEFPTDCVVVEMDNFQEPVLSSFVPLPREKIWNP